MKFSRQLFFKLYKNSFGKLNQEQVNGLENILNSIELDNINNIQYITYMFATVKHECANTYQPIIERGQKSYFDKYEPNTPIGKRLGNTIKGDGYLFRGRGFVQITGRSNYKKLGDLLNENLIDNPEKALQSSIAYKIMSIGMIKGIFTGKKLSDYINENKTDYLNSRKIINGLDRAELIKGYAVKFESILQNSRVKETLKTIKVE